ncbi:MAG: GTP 3',8-cyclase MoaA [Aigarchaeota archaeon]|nr:GTP 3',8-cyclase MoaA [Aigarchaeota archaeon]MDW8092420.1 GTP 3',8-cyclase MoaA [Nitrososphaerota archaeon]
MIYGKAERPLVDSFGRVAKKLRISVTDRCNFRCNFCMPSKPTWLPRGDLLTFEELTRIAKLLSSMGVENVRLTGGEPLMRRDLEVLVRMLAGLPGIRKLSMTTNGYFLAERAPSLRRAGLQSVTVSLHSLKPEKYEGLIGVRGTFDRVMNGIREAMRAGFDPIKINVVITRGCNDDEVLDFVELARRTGSYIRFIEYMPFDGNKPWDRRLLVSGKEIIEIIGKRYTLIELPREAGSTAKNFAFTDGVKGGVGIITSMTEPFCSDCDRIRLTADGKIVPCLFSKDEYDLRPLLRSGCSDEEVEAFIRAAFMRKFRGVETLIKGVKPINHIKPMYKIGG